MSQTDSLANDGRQLTICEAMKEAIAEEMRRDPRVFLMGTCIQSPTFPHTAGLVQEFGVERIVDTPLAEAAMAGAAIGAAQEELRPIVDFMYAGFTYYAASEVMLQTSQYYFLHGSRRSLPIVFIGACGAGRRVGNEHATMVYGTLLHHPGLKVCMPSTPYDAKGMMKSAIRDNNPVYFIWHAGMMSVKGPVPDEEYTIPLGVAEVKRSGSDVTVLASGLQVHTALKVAAEIENDVSVEVIDVRSFEPFDLAAVLQSVRKTSRLVIVDEDYERGGFAAEVAAQVSEHGYDLLDSPVRRVCHPHIPVPGGYMDAYTMPTAQRLAAVLRSLLG